MPKKEKTLTDLVKQGVRALRKLTGRAFKTYPGKRGQQIKALTDAQRSMIRAKRVRSRGENLLKSPNLESGKRGQLLRGIGKINKSEAEARNEVANLKKAIRRQSGRKVASDVSKKAAIQIKNNRRMLRVADFLRSKGFTGLSGVMAPKVNPVKLRSRIVRDKKGS